MFMQCVGEIRCVWQGVPNATLHDLTAAKMRSGRSADSLRSDSADRLSSTASKRQ